eukprot:11640-Heterococcus_DN1.PRE.2
MILATSNVLTKLALHACHTLAVATMVGVCEYHATFIHQYADALAVSRTDVAAPALIAECMHAAAAMKRQQFNQLQIALPPCIQYELEALEQRADAAPCRTL